MATKKSKDECRIQKFIDGNNWIFAKTYAKTAPHEYLVYDNLNAKMRRECLWFIGYIRIAGVEQRYFRAKYTYLYFGEHKYWMMPGDNGTLIVNRALTNQDDKL